MRDRQQKIKKVRIDLLTKMLLRHKKLKIIVSGEDKDEFRERIITINGGSIMRQAALIYKEDNFGRIIYDKKGNPILKRIRYGRYRTSCYREDMDLAFKMLKNQKSKVDLLMGAMYHHDKMEGFSVTEVFTGKDFKRRIA